MDERGGLMKCKFCGADVQYGHKCDYCGSLADYQDAAPEPVKKEMHLEPNGDYIVQPGDTLWGIAKKFYGSGSEYPRIAKKNRIKNPNIIFEGQRLKI